MNNVILIGFMGCGKSTVGIRLSYKLRRVLLDTDKYIEKKEGMSISELFAAKGEAYFRQQETECLKALLAENPKQIISTGGGLPMREENSRLLRELGCVVYLQISANSVYERLKGDTTRPLLQCEDPLGRIEELLLKRRERYEACAELTVNVDGKDREQVIVEIIKGLEERGYITGGEYNEDSGN